VQGNLLEERFRMRAHHCWHGLVFIVLSSVDRQIEQVFLGHAMLPLCGYWGTEQYCFSFQLPNVSG
jgi:hypothetical protein